jgi:phosphonate transport system substrate-binding protein
LGGCYNVLKNLAEIDEALSFFDRISCSGSYLNSMEMIVRGEVDAAAVDSEVLRFKLRASPGLRERLRVLESWIPFPIQPVVLRSGLPLELKARL